MPTPPDASASAAPVSSVTGPVEPPPPAVLSADVQASAEAAGADAARNALVLAAMQTAQDAVSAAVRGMALGSAEAAAHI